MTIRRRDLLVGVAGAGMCAFSPGFTAPPAARTHAPRSSGGSSQTYRRGFDNQRIPDLDNGTFLNPVVSGDRPDPAILKDGADYYMTFSTFDAYPGLTIWHSRDLVNWRPLEAALTRNIGSVWAPSLHKDKGRYLLYIPVKAKPQNDIFVAWADDITGPWSDPIPLGLPNHIDPCHAVADQPLPFPLAAWGAVARLPAKRLGPFLQALYVVAVAKRFAGVFRVNLCVIEDAKFHRVHAQLLGHFVHGNFQRGKPRGFAGGAHIRRLRQVHLDSRVGHAAACPGVKGAGLVDRVLAAAAGQRMGERRVVEGGNPALGIGGNTQALNSAGAVGGVVEYQRAR